MYTYKICEAKMSRDNKKGIVSGKVLDEFTSHDMKMYTPGINIKVKGRNRRVRNVDFKENEIFVNVE